MGNSKPALALLKRVKGIPGDKLQKSAGSQLSKCSASLASVKTSVILIVGLLVFGVATGALLFFRTARSHIGPLHVYELSEQPKFLTEELAIAKAKETLEDDGLDTSAWQPLPCGQTTAPDGRTDQFFSRNTLTTNEGSIVFTNGPSTMRIVRVQLEGNRIVCQNWVLK